MSEDMTVDDVGRDETNLAHRLLALAGVPAPASLLGGIMAGTGLGDAYARMATPLGPALVAYTVEGVSALSLEPSPAAFEHAHHERTGRRAHPVESLPPRIWRSVAARLEGSTHPPRIQFDLRGLREFEAAVLRTALTIPRGEVRPYGWVARAIGNPGAVRAVGSALGHNPIPLLIPCHRVVRSDGHVGNYALGPDAKRRVLVYEGVDPDTLDRLASAGERIHASDTTHIFCYPTCRHARRIAPRHRVAFRSVAAALAAGYRPCRQCRPAGAPTSDGVDC